MDNEGPEVETPDHTVDCGAYSSDDLYPIGVADCALNDWTLNSSLWKQVQIQSGVLPTMAQPNLEIWSDSEVQAFGEGSTCYKVTRTITATDCA